MSTLRTSLDDYEIWFLTGSQGLYGEETLRQVAEQSKTIADTLEASTGIPVRIVWKPVLTDSDAIRRMALEVNANDKVIGVTAWMHTFSPAKMWITGLDLRDLHGDVVLGVLQVDLEALSFELLLDGVAVVDPALGGLRGHGNADESAVAGALAGVSAAGACCQGDDHGSGSQGCEECFLLHCGSFRIFNRL